MSTQKRIERLQSSLAPGERLRVCLVDQGGEVATRYAPLGIMSLEAAALQDETLRERIDIHLLAFDGAASLTHMSLEIEALHPHVIGFSCQGWNYPRVRDLLPTLRQWFPDGILVLGGNHVSNWGERLLRVPEIDIIVSGEGELTFCELLRLLTNVDARDLSEIRGISFRTAENHVMDTPPRPRVASLDDLPSAYEGSSYPLSRIDVALVETNRGCPYRCAYCYWGGAVGQKIARSKTDRFSRELERIVDAKISTIWLCDANFGITENDVEVARRVVECFQRTGYPRILHVTWAKNHVERVERIMTILRDGGVHSDILLPLQTMSTASLRMANRDMVGRAKFLELAQRLTASGVTVGGELIFGLPGESFDDFCLGFDDVFRTFTKTLLHPLVVLPNTSYHENRERFGIITVRPDPLSDFEYVLEHRTLSTDENREGLRLLLSEYIMVFTGFARSTLRALVLLSGHGASYWLQRAAAHIESSPKYFFPELKKLLSAVRREVYFSPQHKSSVRRQLFADRDIALAALKDFIASQVELDCETRAALDAFARYDTLLLPRMDLVREEGFVREERALPFDVPATLRDSFRTGQMSLEAIRMAPPAVIHIEHASGFGSRYNDDMVDLGNRWGGRLIDSPAHSSLPCSREAERSESLTWP